MDKAMSAEEQAFRKLALKMYRGADDSILSSPRSLRDIVVTPYNGHYDEIAGYVIAINGSPPRGVFVTFRPYRETVYAMPNRVHRLNDDQSEIVHAYLESTGRQ